MYTIKGEYPGSNRELTVPHTVALPIELYSPKKIKFTNKQLINYLYFGEAIRTPNSKYQKFMTYPLVNSKCNLNNQQSYFVKT